jgi:hypothetical protein
MLARVKDLQFRSTMPSSLQASKIYKAGSIEGFSRFNRINKYVASRTRGTKMGAKCERDPRMKGL